MREDNPLPFNEMKPKVMKLFETQLEAVQQACRRGKKAFAKEDLSDEDADEATAKLYQVKRACLRTANSCA